MQIEDQPANASGSAAPRSFVSELFSKSWHYDKRTGILDVALLVTAALLVISEEKIFFFHMVFVILTYGAFYWGFRAFALRAVVWVTLTTAVVLVSIIAGEIPAGELIEIPLMSIILILVFFIARQRSLVQDALHRSEEQYHTLFDNLFKESRDAIFITNCEGMVTNVNQSLQDLFGYTELEIVGRDFEQIAAGTSQNGVAILSEVLEKGSIQDYELELNRKNGDKMICLLTSSAWRANDGRVLGYQGIIRDITQRRETDKTLRESEERYRRLVELSFEAVAIHSNGTFVDMNSTGVRLLGAISSEEIIGQPIINFIHPDYIETVMNRVQQQQEGLEHGVPLIEEKFICLDGTVIDVEVAAVPITVKGKSAIQTVIRDITARKRAEVEREKLLATEREQRLLAETLGSVFLALAAQTSREAVLDEILRQVQRVVPYSAANIVLLQGEMLTSVHYHDYHTIDIRQTIDIDRQSLVDYPLDRAVVQSRQPIVVSDTHDNSLWVTTPRLNWIRSFIAVPICLGSQVLGLLRLDSNVPHKFSVKDVNRLHPLVNAAAIVLENTRLYDQAREEIAERIQIEETLRKTAAKNQAMFNAISDSIFQVHRDGRMLDYKIQENPSLGWALQIAEGKKTVQEIFPPEMAMLVLNNIALALDSGVNQIFEYELVLAETVRNLECRLVPIGDDEVLLLLADLTDYKSAKAALEKERARIGRDLHDSLGQSLGYVRLKLDQFTMDDYPLDRDLLRQELLIMRDVTNEAYEIVRSMLATARPSNLMALHTVLLAQAQSVGSRARFKVFFKNKGVPRPLSPIVQQQILFICHEALNNIEKHAAAETVNILLDWNNHGLALSLIDDGHGFGTDVPVDQGHFGLQIMQERAIEINGRLTISSTSGKGTELLLHVPITPVTLPANS